MLPEQNCPPWDWPLFTLFILANITIAVSYFSIPVMLIRSRIQIKNAMLLGCFAIFIFSCGVTHIFQIITLYRPWFWTATWIEMFTGVVSALTAGLLSQNAMRIVEIPRDVVLEDVLEIRKRIEHLSYRLQNGIPN